MASNVNVIEMSCLDSLCFVMFMTMKFNLVKLDTLGAIKIAEQRSGFFQNGIWLSFKVKMKLMFTLIMMSSYGHRWAFYASKEVKQGHEMMLKSISFACMNDVIVVT